MQNLLVTHNFINAESVDEKNLGPNFAKGFATTFFAIVLAITPHHQAAASAAEHQAVLDLVPVNTANRQVVQSGSWSNPATWGGSLP